MTNCNVLKYFGAALILVMCGPAMAAECSYNGSGEVTTSGCETAASSYQMKVYRVGLCTAQPTAPTATVAADLSSCRTVFESSAGSTISVTKGASTDLSGTFTEPVSGASYTYAYVIVDKNFSIQAQVSFASDQTVVDNGGIPVAGKGSGKKCWTLNSSYVDSADLNGSSEYKTVDCGASVGTVGTVTEAVDSLDVGVACGSDGTTTGCTVRDDLVAVSTGGSTVTKQIWIQRNASPLVYSTGKTLDISWSVSKGIGMSSFGTNTITRMITGPLSISFALR
jgi:hypothetical protein